MMHRNRGFTLIEMIIYVALFSIMIGGVAITVYNLIQNATSTSTKVVTQEEINFVLKKLDWALTGADSTTIDVSPTDELEFTNDNIGSDFAFDLDSSRIRITEDGDTDFLTTENVEVESLEFSYDAATKIISVEFVIDGITANFSKYLKI